MLFFFVTSSTTKYNQEFIEKTTVAYLFKARTVEPEKQLLLANSSETTFISRQWPQNKQQNDAHC
jgi:hypothetical protein